MWPSISTSEKVYPIRGSGEQGLKPWSHIRCRLFPREKIEIVFSCTACLTVSHTEVRSLKTRLSSGCRSKRLHWSGQCDARRAGYLSAALIPLYVYLYCRSSPSTTACRTASLPSFWSPFLFFQARPHILHSFIHSFFFPLCVLCSPLIYCWTCLQNDPGAFHSIKEENKDSSSKRKIHPEKKKKNLMYSATSVSQSIHSG